MNDEARKEKETSFTQSFTPPSNLLSYVQYIYALNLTFPETASTGLPPSDAAEVV